MFRRRLLLPQPFVDLAVKHKSKATTNADGQSISRVYAPLFEPMRDAAFTLFEIGVKNGASLRLWEEAFPHAEIYAVDIRKRQRHATERIHVYVGSQSDPVVLDRIAADAGGFDVVIDDGSHLAPDQWASLTTLWPHVRPGGLYIIEDAHTSYRWQTYGMRYGQPENTIGRVCSIVNDVYQDDHDQPVTLDRLAEVSFRFRTVILRKL